MKNPAPASDPAALAKKPLPSPKPFEERPCDLAGDGHVDPVFFLERGDRAGRVDSLHRHADAVKAFYLDRLRQGASRSVRFLAARKELNHSYFNELALGRGRGNRIAIFSHPFQMIVD